MSEPSPALRIPARRILAICSLVLASSFLLSGKARAAMGLEITPYAGYRVGGSFEDNTTGSNLDVKEGGSFGLILDLAEGEDAQYELLYGIQRTKVIGGGTFGGKTLFDLDIHYLHIGGTYLYPQEEDRPIKVRPYIAAGVGATHLVPRGEGMNRKTYFSLSLGGGLKIPVSDRVGLRFEGRGFLTILPDSSEIFCTSSDGAACSVRVQGDTLFQFLLLTGVAFSL